MLTLDLDFIMRMTYLAIKNKANYPKGKTKRDYPSSGIIKWKKVEEHEYHKKSFRTLFPANKIEGNFPYEERTFSYIHYALFIVIRPDEKV